MHLRRVRPCDALYENIDRSMYIAQLLYKKKNEVTYACSYCDNDFNCRSSRNRHHKVCKVRKEQEKKKENDLPSSIEIKNLQADIARLQATVDALTKQRHVTIISQTYTG